ncbi:MAG: RsiV family protein [Dysgonomonas sp.]|nr:RsiV family protein [Dysgonomonas sp.]
MEKVFLLLIFLFIPITGYSNEYKAADNIQLAEISDEEWRFDSLTFQKTIHIDNDTSKGSFTSDIYFIYPVSVPDEINLKDLQKTFARIFSEDENFSGTPQQVFDEVVNTYMAEALEDIQEREKEQNDSFVFSNYEQNKGNSIDDIFKQYILSISTGYYSYTGGIHGNYYESYCNIDLRNCQIIEESQLFKAGYEEKLASLIQDIINERNSSTDDNDHISLLGNITDIKPNQNFCFSENGIIYIYNPYEIGPYSQGMVEIEIPYEEIEVLLNENYSFILNNENL